MSKRGGPRAAHTALQSDGTEQTLFDPAAQFGTPNYYIFDRNICISFHPQGLETWTFQSEPNYLGTKNERTWKFKSRWTELATFSQAKFGGRPRTRTVIPHHEVIVSQSYFGLKKKVLAYYTYKKANHFIVLLFLNITLYRVYWQPFPDKVFVFSFFKKSNFFKVK